MNKATKSAVIHVKPSLEDWLLNNNMTYAHSNDINLDEIDVLVDDIEDLEDEELCAHYGIDYDQVYSIEAA